MNVEPWARLAVFLAVFGAMAIWEWARPRRRLCEPRRLRWPANLRLVLVNTLAARHGAGGAVFSAAVLAAERGVVVLHWVPLPAWAGWTFTLLALDFAIYLQHVMVHAVPALWRLHRVHHADLGFDTSTGVRFHPIEIF